MNQKLHLISDFTQEEIDTIYNYLLEYSIRNYKKHEQELKPLFEEKYQYALNLKKEQQITVPLSDEELETFLLETQTKYQNNLNANKDVINVMYQIPLAILKINMPEDLTDEEKIYYLVEFLTNYITYSEDYFKYCVLTPPTKGFSFDFKNTVPVNHNVESLLIESQGLCDDICNLMIYLGKSFGLSINKINVTYKGRLHAINALKKDNTLSLMDTTRCIREKSIHDQYLLVDKDTLNQQNEYQFHEKLTNTVTLPKTNIRDDYQILKIIQEIKKYTPDIIPKTSKKKKPIK